MRQFSTLVLWLSFFLYGASAVPPNGATDFWQYPTVPTARGQHSAIWTGEEMIIWGGVNAGSNDWGETKLKDGGRYNPVTKKWVLLNPENGPNTSAGTAVWTGEEMIVWGGPETDAAARYNPRTDTWTRINQQGAPTSSASYSAIWTGTEMIIWGGSSGTFGNVKYSQDGAAYNPATDKWRPLSTIGAPAERVGHVAFWTGSEMLIWGGYNMKSNITHYLPDGARYDPVNDIWKPIVPSIAQAPYSTRAVWTGKEMIVWTGAGGGARYDPVSDTWRGISSKGSPGGTGAQTAVWTGSRMIVWLGVVGSPTLQITADAGAAYDPISDTWTPIAGDNAPSVRYDSSAVWTGSRMLIWGGTYTGEDEHGFRHSPTSYANGGEYDPARGIWTQIGQSGAPSPRAYHTAVWTGSEMIIWGGDRNQHDGGRYDPVSNRFKPMVPAPVEGRASHTAVWTGREMIVWGGNHYPIHLEDLPRDLNTGARYDPLKDAWTAVSTNGAPTPRDSHSAIWTGSEMLVWGGYSPYAPGQPYADGGRYDPEKNSWKPISTNGAPSARGGYAVAWTGREMIVWGGYTGWLRLGYPSPGYQYYADGGRYDPEKDSWKPISTSGAPSPRSGALAVWTGKEMIVWAGARYVGTNSSQFDPADFVQFNDGARYDPVEDVWKPMGLSGAPRSGGKTAVWTGSEMVVWGGNYATGVAASMVGGRYDPQTDSWEQMSVVEAPAPRGGHTAVWTGTEMVIWGGQTLDGIPRDDVAIYTPRPPSLEVSKAAGGTALIQWDFPSAGFRLQEAAGLSEADEWKDVDEVPERGDSGWRLKRDSSSSGFYRLIAE
jgi:N-acetylneuraminic acid mutarotase